MVRASILLASSAGDDLIPTTEIDIDQVLKLAASPKWFWTFAMWMKD